MKKKILVVDDDVTSLKLIESILTTNGYETRTSTHAENIEKNVQDYASHLIIMDLIMPKVDGNQAVKRLQKNPALSRIPIVFLTAIKMKDEARQLEFEVNVENKSYRTLTKPIDSKTLVNEIENLIKA